MNIKSQKELNTINEENEVLNTKTSESSDEELAQVSGGQVHKKIQKLTDPDITND